MAGMMYRWTASQEPIMESRTGSIIVSEKADRVGEGLMGLGNILQIIMIATGVILLIVTVGSLARRKMTDSFSLAPLGAGGNPECGMLFQLLPYHWFCTTGAEPDVPGHHGQCW